VPREYLRTISDAILHAQRPIGVFRAINWGPKVHEQFFKRGARELPRPVYPPLWFDPGDKLKELRSIRRRIRGKNAVEVLLRRKCDEFALLVEMLAARGTRRFYELSRRIYGDPRDRFPDHNVDNLAIARLWASRPRARDEVLVYSAEEAAAKGRRSATRSWAGRCVCRFASGSPPTPPPALPTSPCARGRASRSAGCGRWPTTRGSGTSSPA
jgi:hypothetical protein